MQRLPVLSASVNGMLRTKKFHILASVIIVAIAVTFITTRFMKAGSAHLDSSSTAVPNTNVQGGCCANQPNTLRRMIGSFYNTEDNFVSTLTLNNKGPNVIAVTPVLHGKNGQTFNAAQVLVNGESSLKVDLNAIANTAGSHFKSGSFEFTYQGRMMEMGGGLRIVNAANSLIFDEQMLEPGMKFSSPQLEAVYAIPSDKAEVSVIVTNTTAQPLTINGDATFVGANGHLPINGTLSPNETSVVKLPPGLVQQSSTGAVSISHNSASGAVLAMLHVWDKDKGFSAAINFADPAQGKTTQLHGTGLRLGSVNNSILKPVIAVRNIGTTATTVTARVPYTKQNGSTAIITLPQTSLAAGETKLLDTTNPVLSQTDIATAGVEINYTGAFGSVIATVHSVSPDGNQVFTVPMKDPQGGMSSTGGYPWFIDGTASTVVFIKNTTTEDQQFHLDVVYTGGRWGSNLQTLIAGQTMSFDVQRLRDSQAKGSEGNPIPANANAGHVVWTLRGKQDKVLIGRAQTVDLANGLTSTYECQCTCGGGYLSSRMTPGSASGFPGDVTQFTAQEQDATCHGVPMSWYNVSSAAVNFSSDNSNVAWINFDGNATAVAPGTTNLRGSWETAGVWYFDPYEGGCLLQPYNADCSASCNVFDVTISGTVNCKDGDTANFSVDIPPEDPAVSIQWSFTAPSGAGNNPEVIFGSPTNATTAAFCKWFALPDSECSASFDSQYTIRCVVNLSGGRMVTRETSLIVNAYWYPAGSVAPTDITGGPAYGFNTQTNLWVVTGSGSLQRVVSTANIEVPTTSQFYTKTVTHENRHVYQWTTGMLSDLFTVQSLMNQFSPLTDATEQGLITKINNAATAWFNSQGVIYGNRSNDAERDAYAQSDPIAPMYRYTKTCNGY